MATTIGKISRQIERLREGNPSQFTDLTGSDIKLLVTQVINRLFKAEYIDLSFKFGENYPSTALIYTYPAVNVNKGTLNRSYIELPTYPMYLPHNMGVWEISSPNSIGIQFIPLPPGGWNLISRMKWMSLLGGTDIGYEVEGLNVVFTADITAMVPPILQVQVKLIINDISSLSDFDPLPIPPEYEKTVIEEVLQLIMVQPLQTRTEGVDTKSLRGVNQ